MNNQHIKCLINELRLLRIREIEVLDSIDQAIRAEPPASVDEGVSQTAASETDAAFSAVSTRRAQFSVGDRVEITNKVRRLFNRTPTRRDRTTIVVGVAETRIDIITDNGTETWRAPHNLKKLEKNE
jgi:hypothetical protein